MLDVQPVTTRQLAKGLWIARLIIKFNCCGLFFHHFLSLNLAFSSQLGFFHCLINIISPRIYLFALSFLWFSSSLRACTSVSYLLKKNRNTLFMVLYIYYSLYVGRKKNNQGKERKEPSVWFLLFSARAFLFIPLFSSHGTHLFLIS